MSSSPQKGRCFRAMATATAAVGATKLVVPALSSAFTSAPGGLSSTGNTALRGSHGTAEAPASLAAQPAAPRTSSLALSAVAGASFVGAASIAASRQRRSRAVARRVTQDEWNSRVKRIEGDRAVFDVTIRKPLGLVPKDFPNRPGVGVASIKPDGNTEQLNKDVLVDGKPGMFVLEGDEVVSVNGVSVEGKPLSYMGPLVKDAEGDSITLTLSRFTAKGPVKVVFLPEGSMVTMKRGTEIQQAGKNCDAPVAYSCNEGWCKACWMTLDSFPDSVYKACDVSKSASRPAPPHPRLVPEDWDSALPFSLVDWATSMKKQRELKKKQKDAMAMA